MTWARVVELGLHERWSLSALNLTRNRNRNLLNDGEITSKVRFVKLCESGGESPLSLAG